VTSGVGKEDGESIALHRNTVAIQLKHVPTLVVSLSCLQKKEDEEIKI